MMTQTEPKAFDASAFLTGIERLPGDERRYRIQQKVLELRARKAEACDLMSEAWKHKRLTGLNCDRERYDELCVARKQYGRAIQQLQLELTRMKAALHEPSFSLCFLRVARRELDAATFERFHDAAKRLQENSRTLNPALKGDAHDDAG